MRWSEVRPGDVLFTSEQIEGKFFHQTMLIIEILHEEIRFFEGEDEVRMTPVRVMRTTNDERPDFDVIYVRRRWEIESGGWKSVMRKRE
jgi:hypothetical protein